MRTKRSVRNGLLVALGRQLSLRRLLGFVCIGKSSGKLSGAQVGVRQWAQSGEHEQFDQNRAIKRNRAKPPSSTNSSFVSGRTKDAQNCLHNCGQCEPLVQFEPSPVRGDQDKSFPRASVGTIFMVATAGAAAGRGESTKAFAATAAPIDPDCGVRKVAPISATANTPPMMSTPGSHSVGLRRCRSV